MRIDMSWTNRLIALLIISLSTIISFFIVEYSYRYIIDSDINNDFTNRTMLFESGDSFQNHDGYIKYFPNQEIRSLTLYTKSEPISIDDLVIEYDYLIRTNNFGLVMKRDVYPNQRAVFVIGDSFTEGQGASPWFYELEDSYDVTEPQIFNLGILGTGPQQWENLALSTSQQLGLDVVATVINIIPDDMTRRVWTFQERELNCLYHASCDYVYGFQGYNFLPHESNDDIRHSVLNNLTNFPNSDLSNTRSSNVRWIKDFFKKSRVIVDLYRYLHRSLIDTDDAEQSNQDSLLALREAVSGNFYVNVISQKTINSSNYEDSEVAKRLIDFLQSNQINFEWCNIPIDGFHSYDSHPNASGYEHVRACTTDALDELEAFTQ